MEFEYRIICDALDKAEIVFETEDIVDVDMDIDRVYFHLIGEAKEYIIRMWDACNEGNATVVRYSLYKDSDRGGADELLESTFVDINE